MPGSTVTKTTGTVVALTLVALSACTAGDAATATTSTPAPAPTSTTEAPSTTTRPPTTTTTEPPIVAVAVEGIEDVAVATAVADALTALRDPRFEGPLDPGLSTHHVALDGLPDAVTATATTSELASGASVGVVTFDTGDLMLLADEGSGWTAVGSWFTSLGAEPYAGPVPRRVLVLGSDARPGGDPLVHRMDSIHILTADPTARAGAILGYPRDAWVDTPYGSMRLNAIATSGRGVEATFEHFRDTWELPLEGYIVTGFAGFADIVDAVFGRLSITIPIPIPTQPWYPGFRAGDQDLTGERALEFSRTRKGIPGGDFTRSLHHGVVMLAALQMLQDGSIHALPGAIAELSEHVTTDLSAADLIQLGAIGMDLDIGAVTNDVLPGYLGRAAGGASVVFLEDGYEAIVDDVLTDGLLGTAAP